MSEVAFQYGIVFQKSFLQHLAASDCLFETVTLKSLYLILDLFLLGHVITNYCFHWISNFYFADVPGFDFPFLIPKVGA